MRTHIVLGCLCLSLLPATVAPQVSKKGAPKKDSAVASPDRRLSLEQIRKLISIQTPDNVVAEEIRARGIAGDYTNRDIDQIRQLGAGSQTVAILSRLRRVATLIVKTEPLSVVRLDGSSPVFAGQDGSVTLTNIDSGSHQVDVAKHYFKTATLSVDLSGGSSKTIEIKLEWIVGFLSVSVDVPDARIQVGNAAPVAERISRMEIPIGTVPVMVDAPLRTTVARTATIEPGKETVLSIVTTIDPAAVGALASKIHTAFRKGDYKFVLQQSSAYFQTGNRDKDVLGDVALSQLETSAYQEFLNTAHEALSQGTTLSFRMPHHHAGIGKSFTHQAEVEITATEFHYIPIEECSIKPFRVLWRDVKVGKSFNIISINRSSQGNTYVINLKVPSPADPKKEISLNLAVQGETLVKTETVRQLFESLAASR